MGHVRSSRGRGSRPPQRGKRSKSDLYLEALPLFTRGAISIPDHAPLLRELRLLERATHRGGRDSVDHPRAGSDDYANAVCGCAVSARKPSYDIDAVNDALDRVYGRLTTTSLWGMPMATR